MTFNAFLDIALGLVLMFLVLSLLATVINELVATVLKLRAATLKTGIASLIDDDRLRADFYNNGLVAATGGAETSSHASYISGRTFAMALIGSLDPAQPIPAFAAVQNAASALPDSNVRDMLLGQIAAAKGDVDALRTNIATHFDDAMDRVSGAYKRYLKAISLTVGLAIAAAANADTVAVVGALWKDPSVRAQMVEAAASFSYSTTSSTDLPAAVQNVRSAMSAAEAELRPLPLGWSASNIPSGLAWLTKIFGFALTAFAISLGAPFWFDLLSQFMNIRGAGIKPDRTASG